MFNGLNFIPLIFSNFNEFLFPYSINLDVEPQLQQEFLIKARMLFRPFKPQMLNQFHPEASSYLPIIQMDADSLTIIAP